jgi:membrane peptidoglycan carboxypeptidase
VLTLMEEQHRIQPEEARRRGPSRWASCATVAQVARSGLAPYFVEEVRRQLEERFGERLYTETLRVATLDIDAARRRTAGAAAARSESGQLGRFRRRATQPPRCRRGRRYLQGSVVALEVATGDVLAWAAGATSAIRASTASTPRCGRRAARSPFV